MSTTQQDAPDAQRDRDVPMAVTLREVQEIVRTFRDSGWSSMTLDVAGLHLTLGKDGPPRTTPAAGTALAAAPGAPVAEVPAPPAPAAVPATPVAAAAAAAPAAPDLSANGVDTTGCLAVRSPAVGTFWSAPSPGAPPFATVGQVVEQDEQLAIVEIMKLMNPVHAPARGEVVQVCGANAEMVEFDEVLFWIRPDDA